mmetsp:Transcript_16553/g.40512  ORF Transcript_16553/g.40512 Transcript_16553/m.40512 type:complete len:464 (-) Transcript_16553:2078-3469(-)
MISRSSASSMTASTQRRNALPIAAFSQNFSAACDFTTCSCHATNMSVRLRLTKKFIAFFSAPRSATACGAYSAQASKVCTRQRRITLLKIFIILRRISAELAAKSLHLYSAAAATRISILFRKLRTSRFFSAWSSAHSRHCTSAPAAMAIFQRCAASTIFAPISLAAATCSTQRVRARAISAFMKNPSAARSFLAACQTSTNMENALAISRLTHHRTACLTRACVASLSRTTSRQCVSAPAALPSSMRCSMPRTRDSRSTNSATFSAHMRSALLLVPFIIKATACFSFSRSAADSVAYSSQRAKALLMARLSRKRTARSPALRALTVSSFHSTQRASAAPVVRLKNRAAALATASSYSFLFCTNSAHRCSALTSSRSVKKRHALRSAAAASQYSSQRVYAARISLLVHHLSARSVASRASACSSAQFCHRSNAPLISLFSKRARNPDTLTRTSAQYSALSRQV